MKPVIRCNMRRAYLRWVGVLLMFFIALPRGFAADSPITLAGLPIPDIRLPDIGDLRLPHPSSLHINAMWYLPFHTIGFKGGSMIAAFDDNSARGTMGITSTGAFTVSPIAVFNMEMEVMGTTSALSLFDESDAVSWSAMTFGFYGALRFGDPIYAKVRAGWLAKNIYTEEHRYREVENDRVAFPVGMGIGWRLGANHAMELEATYIDRNLSMVTLSFVL